MVIGKGPQVPHKGVIFSGAFVGPVTWTLIDSHGAGRTYTLTGTIQGTLYNGQFVTGTTTQTIHSTASQITQGVGHIRLGDTNILTPEPGTLGLLGTGLVGLRNAAQFSVGA
jgi:hypothetical protein